MEKRREIARRALDLRRIRSGIPSPFLSGSRHRAHRRRARQKCETSTTRARPRTAGPVIDDDRDAVADAELTHGRGERLGPGQHMRQVGRRIGDGVTSKNTAPGICAVRFPRARRVSASAGNRSRPRRRCPALKMRRPAIRWRRAICSPGGVYSWTNSSWNNVFRHWI